MRQQQALGQITHTIARSSEKCLTELDEKRDRHAREESVSQWYFLMMVMIFVAGLRKATDRESTQKAMRRPKKLHQKLCGSNYVDAYREQQIKG